MASGAKIGLFRHFLFPEMFRLSEANMHARLEVVGPERQGGANQVRRTVNTVLQKEFMSVSLTQSRTISGAATPHPDAWMLATMQCHQSGSQLVLTETQRHEHRYTKALRCARVRAARFLSE